MPSKWFALALVFGLAGAMPCPGQEQGEAREPTQRASATGIGYRGWGLRGGLTVDPDQAHVGAHLDLGELTPQLRFMPSVELGFGDDQTTVALNGELAWMFRNVQLNLPENAGIWRPYLGGGLALVYVDRDLPPRSRADSSDTDLGISVLGGLEKRLESGRRFFTELKIGLSDAPDFKLTAGITF